MDPVTAAAAAISVASGESAAVTATTAETSATAASLLEGAEVATEASEAVLGEEGLLGQLDVIQYKSLESVVARNETAVQEVPQIEANRIAGAAREEAVKGTLEKTYPEDAGFRIESQCILRDEAGKIVLDPVSGESRRIDFVVVKDGEVVKSIEVTSETADKTSQIEKEDRIRETGGNFIRDRDTGNLVPFAENVKTEIVRRA